MRPVNVIRFRYPAEVGLFHGTNINDALETPGNSKLSLTWRFSDGPEYIALCAAGKRACELTKTKTQFP